jgi:hypothetical protein
VEEDREEEAHVGPIWAAIEKEVRESKGQANWRCVAVMKDPRNPACIRIAWRNEEEL